MVVFSCWADEVVDNRGKAEGAVPERLKLPEEFRPGVPIKAFMGWDGFAIKDLGVEIVDMCRAWMEAAQGYSCGKCFPCRVGTGVIAETLGRICDGRGKVEDLTKIEVLAQSIRDSSKCGIGQTAPVPLLKALEHYRDRFLEVIEKGEKVPRGNYVVKLTAPCLNACPAHLDIPAYVELVREGKFRDSLRVIREGVCLPGTLGRVCVRPCESNCRRMLVDQSVGIRALKRFVADYELWKKWVPDIPEPEPPKRKKVGVIGAGPAGLSCAYYLALKGYQVTVFERIDEPGGMAAVGIPDYRLPRPILRREVEVITSLGVEIRYNCNVGEDVKFSQLREEFDAVFIGVGAQGSAPMRVEGEDKGYKGFIPGVKYLFAINKGQDPYPEGKTVAVVGGGNVAMDCVRTSFRIGKEDVNLLYRRTRAEMPANEEEIVEAEEEGVKFHFLCAPTKIIAEGDRVKAVELIRMELGEPDESGRRRPVPVPGSEFVIETDILIPAIGQRVDLSFLEESDGVRQSKWRTVEADPDTKQTSQPDVFSAGDCVTGPDVLVRAVADGRIAAEMIDRFLRGEEVAPTDDQLMEKLFSKIGVFNPEEPVGMPPGWPREESVLLSPEVRKRTFEEIDKGLKTAQAIREGARCLRCYRIGMVAL